MKACKPGVGRSLRQVSSSSMCSPFWVRIGKWMPKLRKPYSGRKPPPAVVSGHVAVWYLAVFAYGYEWRGTCMHQADDEAAFYMNRFRSITALLAAASALAFAQDPTTGGWRRAGTPGP